MSINSGLQAWLPEDVKQQEEISSKLVSLYQSRGFAPIDIPTVVEMSVVEKANKKFTTDVFKLFDEHGRTLALRTEMTQPIAKMVASYSSKLELPIGFYYNAKVYRYKGLLTDSSKEVKQIGVEYFAGDSSKVDLEILDLLLASLAKLGIEDFKVNLTHAVIWQKIFGLYGSSGMSFEAELDCLMQSKSFRYKLADSSALSLAARFYKLLLEKDLVAIEKLVDKEHDLYKFIYASSVEDVEKIFALDLTVLKQALSLDARFGFNPCQCPDLKLYTGLHFNVFARGQGKQMAIGGRYDKLCAQFAKDIPAIGFAFYLSALLDATRVKKQTRVLRIAAAKGTLFEGAKEYLTSKGIKIEEDSKRKLIIKASSALPKPFDSLEILMVRGHDVPTYVQHGAADIGIVGLDVILDSKTQVVQLKDLDYGKCRLSVCGIQGEYSSVYDLPKNTRVVTSFPNLTQEYFDLKGVNAEVIKLYGSVELGPLTGLSDIIVDLVASGKTLAANGLEELEEILTCTSRLIVNPAYFSWYREELLKF